MTEPLTVVKLGGAEGVDFSAICQDAASLLAQGRRLVLVHGGSAEANALGQALGTPARMLTSPSGHSSRYTDRLTLEIFLMAVNGKLNSLLVEGLQSLGVNAFGLCGLDGRLIQAVRKEAVTSVENGKRKIIRDDYTGKIARVEAGLLKMLLEAGCLPVVAPVAVGEGGEALNVDADRAAASIAAALHAETLLLLTAAPGLLARFPDEASLIRQLRPDQLAEAAEAAQGRMKKKVLGAQEALAGGVGQVIIADGRVSNPISNALAGSGTVIKNNISKIGWSEAPIHLGDKNTIPLPAEQIFALEERYSAGTYAKQPLVFVRGQGASLFTIDGHEYLDCASGHGVASLGHAHPKVAEAIARQAATLITLFETFPNDQRALLMHRLASLVPGLERVFLCNSGTEAVEAALKFARLSTGRPGIVAAMRAFHGRTYGALSATYNKKYRAGFEPLLPGFSHVPFNNIEALEAAVSDQTAAVILEAVQGEGGVYPAQPGYLEAARRICDQHGALLVIDEIQTGYGRTGRMFAFQHSGVTPDLLPTAKALAGGLPAGALLIGRRVQNLAPGVHGSTFGGNPLACAAALAALAVIEGEDLPGQAAAKGRYLLEKLQTIDSPHIREVRGLGLMVGIELKEKAAPVIKRLQERRVLALNAGMTVIRLLPPLVISYAQLDHLVEALEACLGADGLRIDE